MAAPYRAFRREILITETDKAGHLKPSERVIKRCVVVYEEASD